MQYLKTGDRVTPCLAVVFITSILGSVKDLNTTEVDNSRFCNLGLGITSLSNNSWSTFSQGVIPYFYFEMESFELVGNAGWSNCNWV